MRLDEVSVRHHKVCHQVKSLENITIKTSQSTHSTNPQTDLEIHFKIPKGKRSREERFNTEGSGVR